MNLMGRADHLNQVARPIMGDAMTEATTQHYQLADLGGVAHHAVAEPICRWMTGGHWNQLGRVEA